ncbi:MAG: amidohydrolase family protein [Acidobacteriota bacterium]|nr:amidohydrolase family protein [Acidobacteriota bacterium]
MTTLCLLTGALHGMAGGRRPAMGPETTLANVLSALRAECEDMIPPQARLFDAHTHLGLDEDGRSLDLPGLLSQLDEASVARAAVFPLHDPERRPAYRLPNDRVLGWAAESAGRLVPFCRLDPFEDPIGEGHRALAAGARGIKLHPRAQSFTFHEDGLGGALRGIFGLAEEARVPILIHAGRGLPPIAEGLAALALEHPEVVLILAHGAICDQGILSAGLAEHDRILYDTSCFYPLDLSALFARVPAERIVFGSDPPYGRPAGGLYLTLRAARAAGLDEEATRLVLGETMEGLLAGRGLPPRQQPRGSMALSISTRLMRLYAYTSLAGPALFNGMVAPARESLELALGVCRDPEPGADRELLESAAESLSGALAILRGEDAAEPANRTAAFALIRGPMVRAATEDAIRENAAPALPT